MRLKLFPTSLTVRIAFGVFSDVNTQVILLCKAFLTMVTPIWFLFGVSPDVSCEAPLLCKTFLAIITLVWFFFGMGPDVTVKMRPV